MQYLFWWIVAIGDSEVNRDKRYVNGLVVVVNTKTVAGTKVKALVEGRANKTWKLYDLEINS